MTTKFRTIDRPIAVYSLAGIAALIVSAPATYRLVALYHSDGSTVGVVATVALLIILEVGAVAAKLSTLWTPRNHGPLQAFTLAALGVNTLSNLIHGGAVATANGLPWLAAWGGALIYAAALPALVYLMLHQIVDRANELRGLQRSTADEVARILLPVAHAVEVARQAQASLASISQMPALPEPQVVYPRPQHVADVALETPKNADPWACATCGTVATTAQHGAAGRHGYWTCKGCGARQNRQKCD